MPPEPEFRAEFWGNEFWTPEFWTRILESNFLTLFFPAKEAPWKILPQEIHLPKFTSKNSPQNSGWKIHIALLQGHFAENFGIGPDPVSSDTSSWLSAQKLRHSCHPHSSCLSLVSWRENAYILEILLSSLFLRTRQVRVRNVPYQSWFSGRGCHEDSNFSVFRVRRFTEWPEPLHRIAFPVEILTKPLIHWLASPPFHWQALFFTEMCFVASPSQKSAPTIDSWSSFSGALSGRGSRP